MILSLAGSLALSLLIVVGYPIGSSVNSLPMKQVVVDQASQSVLPLNNPTTTLENNGKKRGIYKLAAKDLTAIESELLGRDVANTGNVTEKTEKKETSAAERRVDNEGNLSKLNETEKGKENSSGALAPAGVQRKDGKQGKDNKIEERTKQHENEVKKIVHEESSVKANENADASEKNDKKGGETEGKNVDVKKEENNSENDLAVREGSNREKSENKENAASEESLKIREKISKDYLSEYELLISEQIGRNNKGRTEEKAHGSLEDKENKEKDQKLKDKDEKKGEDERMGKTEGEADQVKNEKEEKDGEKEAKKARFEKEGNKESTESEKKKEDGEDFEENKNENEKNVDSDKKEEKEQKMRMSYNNDRKKSKDKKAGDEKTSEEKDLTTKNENDKKIKTESLTESYHNVSSNNDKVVQSIDKTDDKNYADTENNVTSRVTKEAKNSLKGVRETEHFGKTDSNASKGNTSLTTNEGSGAGRVGHIIEKVDGKKEERKEVDINKETESKYDHLTTESEEQKNAKPKYVNRASGNETQDERIHMKEKQSEKNQDSKTANATKNEDTKSASSSTHEKSTAGEEGSNQGRNTSKAAKPDVDEAKTWKEISEGKHEKNSVKIGETKKEDNVTKIKNKEDGKMEKFNENTKIEEKGETFSEKQKTVVVENKEGQREANIERSEQDNKQESRDKKDNGRERNTKIITQQISILKRGKER